MRRPRGERRKARDTTQIPRGREAVNNHPSLACRPGFLSGFQIRFEIDAGDPIPIRVIAHRSPGSQSRSGRALLRAATATESWFGARPHAASPWQPRARCRAPEMLEESAFLAPGIR